ncbi:hypothetical protein CLV24_105165 [Pontibacter ummariensis]|uniref:Phosphoribosylpyrophosphate synthetase n=1 Tax=Pontibacter ummariensis TaxID=1610492 RepID=A0A239DT23_9BACT|nr:hypothetical protein [Pontibacter ummariensis]PRY13795.1 hypothetical protein CLV24_105165 [Pontibacter ummariensis]SNS34903.1 hypothetical protein SAMN06296052_10587 [Pontibacter ummariensis]
MSKYNYDTLSEALEDLKERGYTADFGLRPYCLECLRLQLELGAGEFEVDEVHQFKDARRPAQVSSAVYAISSNKGIKGVLVDTRGVCADSVIPEMALKLGKSHLH